MNRATLPADPGAVQRPVPELRRTLAAGGALARVARRELAFALACALGVNLLILTPTVYMLQLYERVLYSMSGLTLLAVSAIAAVLLAVMALLDRARGRWLRAAGLRIERMLASRLHDAGYDAGLRGVAPAGGASLRDAATLHQFVAGPGFSGLLDLPWTPVYLAVAALLHPWLGIAAAGFVCCQLLLALASQRIAAPRLRAADAARRDEFAFTRWKFRHAEVVAGLGMGAALRARWQQRHAASLAGATESQAAGNRLTAASKALRYAQQSLALALGGWLVVRGELTAGAMIASTLLVTRALAPVDAVVSIWKDVVAAAAALRRIDAARGAAAPSQPRLVVEQADADSPLNLHGVDARVPGCGRTVLHALDLALLPGEVTALVGASGAGKSTLARLVAGAWPDASGRLVRPACSAGTGYLPQAVELFDGSVAENIARMGQPQPQAVVAAAQAVGLHDALLHLPRGYDTVVGEGGHPLTAGLRQRVGLARAVYGQPRLLVLDEPDAHLDEAGERALAALLRAAQHAGCIVLVVTHRSALLAACDRILTLERGRLVADERRGSAVSESALTC